MLNNEQHAQIIAAVHNLEHAIGQIFNAAVSQPSRMIEASNMYVTAKNNLRDVLAGMVVVEHDGCC